MRFRTLTVSLMVLAGTLLLAGVWFGLAAGSPAIAQSDPTPTPSAYRELLDTEIRGLSPETIDGYRNGAGMGMALPAELNGYPGPRHILDLADDLELTTEQYDKIQALFDTMLPVAVELGEQILNEEAALEQAYRDGTVDDAFLHDQLVLIGQLEAELRYTHLRTHLSTIDILTPYQVTLYNVLRGYEDAPMDHSSHQHG